jgi:hypothetical protein
MDELVVIEEVKIKDADLKRYAAKYRREGVETATAYVDGQQHLSVEAVYVDAYARGAVADGGEVCEYDEATSLHHLLAQHFDLDVEE